MLRTVWIVLGTLAILAFGFFVWPVPQMVKAPATAAPVVIVETQLVPVTVVVEVTALPPTSLPSTPVPTATAQPMQVGIGCPTEAEFEALVGVRADIDRTEPCTFHWRGDPKTLGVTHPSPLGWISTLGVDSKNYVYIGDDGLAPLEIFSGTWRMVSIFPAGDAVYDKCAFLLKVQYEGQISSPQWTAEAGNFVCP